MSVPINRDLVKFVIKRQNDLIRQGKIPRPLSLKNLSGSKPWQDLRAAMFPKFDGDERRMNTVELVKSWRTQAAAAIAFTMANLDKAVKASSWPVSNVVEKVDGFEMHTTYNQCMYAFSVSVGVSASDNSRILSISIEDQKVKKKLSEPVFKKKLEEYVLNCSPLMDVILDVIWKAIEDAKNPKPVD